MNIVNCLCNGSHVGSIDYCEPECFMVSVEAPKGSAPQRMVIPCADHSGWVWQEMEILEQWIGWSRKPNQGHKSVKRTHAKTSSGNAALQES